MTYYKESTLTNYFSKLSLGDARAYYLSTAKNELGVVSAESAAGKIVINKWFKIYHEINSLDLLN